MSNELCPDSDEQSPDRHQQHDQSAGDEGPLATVLVVRHHDAARNSMLTAVGASPAMMAPTAPSRAIVLVKSRIRQSRIPRYR